MYLVTHCIGTFLVKKKSCLELCPVGCKFATLLNDVLTVPKYLKQNIQM